MALLRLYLANAAATYTPTTIRGAWDDTTQGLVRLLGAKTGIANIKIVGESSTTNNYDVLALRLVSEPLSAVSFTTSDTASWSFGTLESSSLANNSTHIHIFATAGNTDTVRGTLLLDSVADTTEWPITTAASRYHSQTLTNNVSLSSGDRIVVELGFTAANTSATLRQGTIDYGNTGGTDLNAADGDTAVTTRTGWVEFSYTPASSGPANLKSYDGNVKANIKSLNTNPIANVKSLNTNT